MEAEDYVDEKYPDFDFLNFQVNGGLDVGDKKDKRTVMHPRLRSIWRVQKDTRKTLQVACGPTWPTDKSKFDTSIYDTMGWGKKRDCLPIYKTHVTRNSKCKWHYATRDESARQRSVRQAAGTRHGTA